MKFQIPGTIPLTNTKKFYSRSEQNSIFGVTGYSYGQSRQILGLTQQKSFWLPKNSKKATLGEPDNYQDCLQKNVPDIKILTPAISNRETPNSSIGNSPRLSIEKMDIVKSPDSYSLLGIKKIVLQRERDCSLIVTPLDGFNPYLTRNMLLGNFLSARQRKARPYYNKMNRTTPKNCNFGDFDPKISPHENRIRLKGIPIRTLRHRMAAKKAEGLMDRDLYWEFNCGHKDKNRDRDPTLHGFVNRTSPQGKVILKNSPRYRIGDYHCIGSRIVDDPPIRVAGDTSIDHSASNSIKRIPKESLVFSDKPFNRVPKLRLNQKTHNSPRGSDRNKTHLGDQSSDAIDFSKDTSSPACGWQTKNKPNSLVNCDEGFPPLGGDFRRYKQDANENIIRNNIEQRNIDKSVDGK
jgi:hypothetical protein